MAEYPNLDFRQPICLHLSRTEPLGGDLSRHARQQFIATRKPSKRRALDILGRVIIGVLADLLTAIIGAIKNKAAA